MINKGHLLKLTQIFFILFCFELFAQHSNISSCGTEVPENFFDTEKINKEGYNYFLEEYYNKVHSKSSTAITNVPVKIHIVTDSDGSTNITESQILDEINEANSFLANSFLEITVCEETNFISDNNLYLFDISDDQGLLYSNNQSNILNIYFVESINDGDVAGYTYLPGNPSQYYDVIVMDNQATTNNISSTLIHEFGHHFNLIHTHGPTNVPGETEELVNGTNCSSTGDRFCDTPADPLINSSNVSSVNCLYTGNATDALGQIYDPDTSNIMSYSPDVCTDFFSVEQYAYMYAGYHYYRGTYYECPSFSVSFDYEKTLNCNNSMTVNFTDTSVGATSWEWDVNGDDVIDYTIQNPTHTFNEPGSYDVALTISNGESEITKVFPQLFIFNSTDFETSIINLDLFIVDINENTWEFKNSNDDILYSGGPYPEMGEYNYEFDTSNGDCYSFVIYDSAGNGLASTSWTVGGGSEFYELTTENGLIIQSNNNFGFEELTLINNQSMSLNEINFKNQVNLYPNPADDHIKIRYLNILPNSYKIFDLNGRLIYSKAVNNNNDLEVDVSGFERGFYFIAIQSGKNIDNLKFLVK